MNRVPEGVEGLGRLRPYEEYADSGVEWLGDIPSGWDVVRNLGLFSDRRERGFADLPIYSVTQRDGVIPQNEVTTKIVKASENKDGYKRIHPGDLVYNKMRMWQGAVGTSPATAIVSPAYVVCRSRCEIEPRFFEYLYRTPIFVTESGRHSYGICDDMNSLRFDDFKGIYSIVPPVPEQRAIAEFLDRETGKIDALVAKKERLIELLREKRTALITHAVTKGLDPNAPMKDSGVEWLREIPKHWEVKRLWHLTPDDRQIMYGIVLPGPNFDGGVPIVKGGDVKPGRLSLDRLNRTDPEIEVGYARSRLRGGDIVYAIRGSIGDAELVPNEIGGANLTQDAARIAPASGVFGTWLLYAVKSEAIFRQLEAGALGATIRGINIRDLKRAFIPVPSFEEQKAIALKLADFDVQISRLVERAQDGLDRLREFRTALISAAVTGKIDVREKVA